MTPFIKKFTHLFILLIILGFTGSITAQKAKRDYPEIDSLLLLLRDKNNDTIQINHLNEIAWIYRKINADSSIYYANQALSSNNIHPRGLVKSYNTLGVNDYMKSDFHSSVDWFEKALAVCYQTNYKEGIAKTANNIGTIYQMLGKHTKSLVFNQQSLKMKEELRDTIGLVNSLINISSLYYQLNKFNDAIAHSSRALRLAEIKVPGKIPLILNSLGVHYKELGNHSKALEYLNRSLEINTQNNDEKRIAINKQNIADTYSVQGDYDKAMLSYLDALLIKEKINDKRGIAKTKMGIGVLALKQGVNPWLKLCEIAAI
jgi:tetratricopeptide (TPR) repeat protein